MSLKVDIDAQSINGYLDAYLHYRSSCRGPGKKKNVLTLHSRMITECMKNYKVFRSEDLYLLEQLKLKSVVCLRFLGPELLIHIDKALSTLKAEYCLSLCQMDHLPREVIKHIISFLAIDHYTTLRLVNKRWKRWTAEILGEMIDKSQSCTRLIPSISKLSHVLKICGVKVHILKFEDFKKGKNLDNHIFSKMLKSCPNLHTLIIAFEKCQIDYDCLKTLLHCQNLKIISFSKLIWVGSEAGEHITNCSLLEKVQISRASSIGIAKLARLTNLTDIDLQGCHEINNYGLKKVISMPNLISINLNGCVNITELALKDVVSSKTLQILKVRHTKITDSFLKDLGKSQNPYLHILDIGHTQATDHGVSFLILLPGLKVLNLEGLGLGKGILFCLSQSRMNKPEITS